MSNIEIKCEECGQVFYFTERDQEFYKQKGFQQPKRCFKCRQARKARMEGRN